MDYQRHGLKGEMQRRVFNALLEMQAGRCAICGISQDDLKTREYCPEGSTPLPVAYRMLYIDHCHETGCIRGLLCNRCNDRLGAMENAGIFHYLVTPAFKYNLSNELPIFIDEVIFYYVGDWFDDYKGIILLYMQRERWFPRKDILFHLQTRTNITP